MKTVKLWLAVAAIALTGLQTADAQSKLPTGEEVLMKYVTATGGVEKYKAVKSMKASGTLSLPEAGITGGKINVKFLLPGRISAKISLPGIGDIDRGSDGTTCWESSAMQGPRIVTGAEADAMLTESNMSRIYDPKSFYKSMETKGIEEVNGEKCYKVELTKKDDSVVEAFYSVESGLEMKSISEQATPMGKMKIESFSSNYKDVDGIKVAHQVTQKLPQMSQVITMEKVEYNAEMTADDFKLPADIQKMVDKKKAKESKGGDK